MLIVCGTWFDENNFFAELVNAKTGEKAFLDHNDAGELIDAETGEKLKVTESQEGHQVEGWACGHTFLMEPSAVVYVKRFAAGL